MKIIIYSNSLWNIFNFRQSLIDALKKRYKVLIICKKSRKIKYLKKYKPNLTLIEIKSNNTVLSFLEELISFIKISKKFRPDIVLSFTHKSNIINILSSKIVKYRSLSVITGLGSFFLEKKYFFFKFLIKYLYKYSSKAIFQNKFDQKLFNLKNSFLIPGSGVDTKKFIPKKKFNYKKVNFYLISRIIKDKGIYEYFLASKNIKNKNFKFNFVGDFSTENPSKLNKRQFENLKNNSSVLCHQYKKNVNFYLNKTDCLVLPSYREGLSKIILEAMSKGIPILGSKVPGIQDILRDNFNGYLFKPKSIESLTNVILKFTNTPIEKKKRFGKRSINLIKKKYSDKKILEKYLSVIEKLR